MKTILIAIATSLCLVAPVCWSAPAQIPTSGLTHSFEDSANPTNYSNYTAGNGVVAIDSAFGCRGSKSLHCTLPSGSSSTKACIRNTAPDQEGANRYISFRVYLAPEVSSSTYRIPATANHSIWHGGNVASAGFYIYFGRNATTGYKNEGWQVVRSGTYYSIGTARPARGVWHDIQIALTAWGTANTVMDVWIDGVHVQTTAVKDTTGLAYDIETFGAYSVAGAATENSEFWIDDIRVSETAFDLLCHDQYVLAVPVDDTVVLTTACSIASTASLEYGTASGVYGDPVASTASESNTQHGWVLSSLAAASTIYYRITYTATGNANDVHITPEYQFKTDPGASADTVVCVFTDRHDAAMIGSLIQDHPPGTADLYIDDGDSTSMSDAGSAALARVAFIHSMAMLKPYTTVRLFAPVAGNHDVYSADGGAAWLSYAGLDGPYSFDFGRVHYSMLSYTGTTFAAGDLTWLDADLTAATRSYRVVCSHYGSVVWGAPYASLSNYDDLFDILAAQGVALNICGHRHVDNRFVTGGLMVLNIPSIMNSLSASPLDNAGEAGRLPAWGTRVGGSGTARGYALLNVGDHHIEAMTYHIADGVTAQTLADRFNWHPGMNGTRTSVSQ